MTGVAAEHVASTPNHPEPAHRDRHDDWRRELRRPAAIRASAVLACVVGVAALVMLLARRTGHWWGDDWALYLRQADALLHADAGRVAAENRFTVDQSLGPPFSPPVYPWGFPIVLTPFVAAFGTDLDQLALVSTAAACVFACCWYALARPRLGTSVALIGTFAVVTSPLVLLWTELIQSEWTFLAVVGLAFVGLDRVLASGALVDTTRPIWPVVLVGIGAAAAFSVRREGFALTPAIATAQLMAIRPDGASAWRQLRDRPSPALLGRLAAPHAAALSVVIVVMLALPSTLVPSYEGTSVANVARFAGQHLEHIGEVSGVKSPWRDAPTILGNVPAGWVGFVLFFVVSAFGIAIALTVNRRRDAHFVCYLAVALIIGGSFRTALNRYVATIGPLLVLLGLVALGALGRRMGRPRLRPVLVTAPLLVLVAGNVGHALDRIDASTAFDDAGRVEWGPAHPDAVAMYDTVIARTDADDVVGAPKARAMTWATGRKALQIGGPWRIPTAATVDLIVLELDDGLRTELDAGDRWQLAWVGRRFVVYERTG